ncbi:MAG: ISL3 family transposase [Thermosynechococcaceae cyanobacterium]
MDFYINAILDLPNATATSFAKQDNEVFLGIRFLNETGCCPHCGQMSENLTSKRTILVRDLPVFGKAVYLEIPRRQYYCTFCQKYFTENLSFVDLGRSYTGRYESYIYKRVQVTSIEQVSREEELSWDQVKGIFDHQFSKEKTSDWKNVKRISIDEVSKRKGHKDFATVASDIESGKLLEVIDSHKQEEIITVLMQQPIEVREQIEEVSIDMWGGFPKVVQEVFPKAKVVIDRFHVMKAVNEELDTVRKQTKKRTKKEIKGSKFTLLKNEEDLNEEERKKLEEILKQSKRLRMAYEFKEEFRAIFEAHQTVEEGKKKVLEWLEKAKRVYTDTVKTIQKHLEGICNYFLNRTSSGVMEGINNRIKLIKRQAYGFVNFDNFRARLLACFAH